MDWFERNVLLGLTLGLSHNFMTLHPTSWLWFILFWYTILMLVGQTLIFIMFIFRLLSVHLMKNTTPEDADEMIREFTKTNKKSRRK